MRWPPTAFGSLTLNNADIAAHFEAGRDYSQTASLAMSQRRNSSPIIDSFSIDGRTIPMLVSRPFTSTLTADQFHSAVNGAFDPGKGRDGVQYLTVAGPVTLRLPVHVVSKRPHPRALHAYEVVLEAAQSHLEANALDTSGANPPTVTNSGNVAVAPILELTHATHVTRRACTVAGVGAGGGLLRTPVKFALNSTAATSTNVFVFVEGVSVPCLVVNSGLSTSAVYALLDTASDGTTTTAVDIIYGAGLVNPLAGVLRLGSLSLTDGATAYSDNTQWVWGRTGAPDWTVSDDAAIPGLWQPSRAGNHSFGNFSYGIGAESTSSIQFLVRTGTNALGPLDFAADSMQVIVGAAANSALLNFQRVLSGMTSGEMRAYVRYRVAGSASWVTAWSATASATVTASITITGAVQINAGIEVISDPTTNGSVTFNSNSTAGAVMAKAAASQPTVVVGSAANTDRYDGTITIGNYQIHLNNVMTLDGTLILDCQNRTITSSVAGAPVYGGWSFSDPSVIALLQPGSNAVAHTTGGSLVVKHRAGYS